MENTFKVLARVSGAALIGLTTLVASPAEAQNAPRWSVSFGAGTTPTVSGLYHGSGRGTVLGLSTAVQERKWSDIYGAGFGMRAGVGYGVTDRLEFLGSFRSSRQDAENLSVGTVAGLDLRSTFGNYREWGVEGGVRWHFTPDARVIPFIGAAAGLRQVEAMPATFSVPAAGVVLANTPFYDSSTLPTFGADLGVQFAVASRVRIGIEGALRWIGDLKTLEGLAGTGLENLNDASNRWSMPLLGTVSFRF